MKQYLQCFVVLKHLKNSLVKLLIYLSGVNESMTWRHQAKCRYLRQWWSSIMTHLCTSNPQGVNTLRPRQNGRHFADDIFKRIFFNENVWISIKISLKFVPKGPINIIPAMFWIMAWRRPGDKPLSEAMLVILLTLICVTRPQWIK